MIEFRYHDLFENEIAALEKRRLRRIRESLDGLQRLCEYQFHPTSPERKIAPGKLHCVTRNDTWEIWKTELPVIDSGLRPNQYPRIWFIVAGVNIIFLCIASHSDNYRDNDMDRTALTRAADFY